MLSNYDLFSDVEQNVTDVGRPPFSDMINGQSRLINKSVTTKINSNGKAVQRTLSVGDRVKVYRNLNKPEFHSAIQCKGADKNKVACYAKVIVLEDVSFKVSEASRQRVLKSVRNVHAFCTGTFLDCYDGVFTPDDSFIAVTYQPRELPFFFVRESKKLLSAKSKSRLAIISGANVYLSDIS